jgi:hypothetical protein
LNEWKWMFKSSWNNCWLCLSHSPQNYESHWESAYGYNLSYNWKVVTVKRPGWFSLAMHRPSGCRALSGGSGASEIIKGVGWTPRNSMVNVLR